MTRNSNLAPVVYCQLKTDHLDLQTLVLELEPRHWCLEPLIPSTLFLSADLKNAML